MTKLWSPPWGTQSLGEEHDWTVTNQRHDRGPNHAVSPPLGSAGTDLRGRTRIFKMETQCFINNQISKNP